MNNNEGSKNYLTAIGFLNSYTSKLDSITSQLSSLTNPPYQSSILSAVANMQDQLSAFNQIQSYLPNIDYLSVTSPMLDISRQATIAITDLSNPSIITQLAESVGTNYKPWYEENIVKTPIISSSLHPSLNIADASSNLASFLGTNTLSALTLQSSIVEATKLSLFAEKSLCSINLENIGSKLSLGTDEKKYLSSSFIDLSNSYSGLLQSFESNPLTYTQLNPSLSKFAPIEYFSSADLLEVISTTDEITPEKETIKNEIQHKNEISLNSYLSKIDPRLHKMWKGAIEAYHSKNPDHVRHFSASIRELFTHLMHKLAPDDEIKQWTTESTYYHQGNPIRKARLLYICRNIANGPFNEFINKDVEAMLAFINILQQGTHDIDPAFPPNHLVTIKNKAESTLKFLLEIHFTSNNPKE